MDNNPIAQSKKRSPIAMLAVVAIVFAAAGFGGGLMFQKSRDSLSGLSGEALTKKMTSLGMSGFGARVGDRNVDGMGTPPVGNIPGGRQFGNGGGFINGQIINSDGQSVTIKQQDGSTKTAYYSATTAITKSATGTASDLSVGTEVSATGTTNSDGSVTAQTIRINPVVLNADPNANTTTQ